MKFAEIQLHPLLQANLDKIKFNECTQIQEQAIPVIRTGKDVAGLAQTGTGKTGAFLIPLIDRMLKAVKPDETVADSATVPFNEWKKKQYVLVLVPTRELADQVLQNAKTFLEGTGFDCVAVFGGTTYEKQTAALKGGVEFVIATPGRLIDLFKEHIADLGLVRAVIFDEADRMFDMGFKDDMKFILRRIPRDRQILMFSATLNFDVLNVAYEFGADPVEVNISRDQAKAENVTDKILHVGSDEKPRYLLSLLKKMQPRQAIIFSNFKHNVEKLERFLTSNSVPAVGISSLLTQAQRNRVMAQFKGENDRNILVATDVAARGLDILGVDVIFNYDLPDDPENYVHRIGRTGRAGATGTAFSLVGEKDVEALQRIEEYLKHKVEQLWLDDADLVQDFKAIARDQGRPRPPQRFEGRGGPRSGGGPPKHRDRDRGRGRDGDRRPNPPRAQAADGQRTDGPRTDSRPQERRPRPTGGGGTGAHRDRQSGRHGGSATNSGGGAAGNGRPSHQQNRPRPDRGQQNQDQSRHGGRPRHAGGGSAGGARRPQARPAASARSASANPGLGQKVSGFLKRLFGKDS